MSWATIHVFLIASAFVCNAHSARDEGKDKGKVHVSVRPRSFSQIREDAQPGEDRSKAAASSDVAASQHAFQEAQAGMETVSDEAKDVRKAVEELERSTGLDQKAHPSESQMEQAQAKLAELARERKAVQEHADKLDRQMQEEYAAMIGSKAEHVASLLSISQHEDNTMSEDEQFAELEKQTNQITQWFSELKQLRAERDAMIAHKRALSANKVQKQDQKADASEEQRQNLASVMASSAIEMAQIKSASDDVLSAIDALTDWKKRDDNSPESHAEAVKVQAKLSKAVKFLQEHEDLVNTRAKQINTLMKEAGMPPL